jgi:DNA-binding beta-propeller fold protein YncE
MIQLEKYMKKQSHCVFCAFLLLVLSLPASAELVYAVDSGGDALYKLDTDSGNTTFVGALHADVGRYTTPTSMAVNPLDGKIYIRNASPASDRGLSFVDPVSGNATLIANGFFGHIAFDSNGTLFGQTLNHAIATIDPETGAITDLGGPNISSDGTIFGFDYNEADGLLYAINSFSTTLWKINPNDGEIAETLAVSCTSCGTAGALLFASDGTLILSDLDSQLFDIDTATGIASNMRMVNGNFADSAPSPQGLGQIVPVPAAVWLFGSGLFGLIGISRRKKAA